MSIRFLRTNAYYNILGVIYTFKFIFRTDWFLKGLCFRLFNIQRQLFRINSVERFKLIFRQSGKNMLQSIPYFKGRDSTPHLKRETVTFFNSLIFEENEAQKRVSPFDFSPKSYGNYIIMRSFKLKFLTVFEIYESKRFD